MVRAAVAAFGIPFLLSLGALAVVRFTRAGGAHQQQATVPAPARPATEGQHADPLAMLGDAKLPADFGRHRADQLKLDALHRLVPAQVVTDWCTSLNDVTHRAVSDATQQAVRNAAPTLWPVFLSREPASAKPADVLTEINYVQVDVCLAAVAKIVDETDRQELAGYVKSQVVKIAELLEMRPVDVHKLYSRELPKVSEATESPHAKAVRILDLAAESLPTANTKKTAALKNLLPESRYASVMAAFGEAGEPKSDK